MKDDSPLDGNGQADADEGKFAVVPRPVTRLLRCNPCFRLYAYVLDRQGTRTWGCRGVNELADAVGMQTRAVQEHLRDHLAAVGLLSVDPMPAKGEAWGNVRLRVLYAPKLGLHARLVAMPDVWGPAPPRWRSRSNLGALPAEPDRADARREPQGVRSVPDPEPEPEREAHRADALRQPQGVRSGARRATDASAARYSDRTHARREPQGVPGANRCWSGATGLREVREPEAAVPTRPEPQREPQAQAQPRCHWCSEPALWWVWWRSPDAGRERGLDPHGLACDAHLAEKRRLGQLIEHLPWDDDGRPF